QWCLSPGALRPVRPFFCGRFFRVEKMSREPRDASAVMSQARLSYWSDQAPAIQRIRRGRSFRYVSSRGKTILAAPTLARIRNLAIPPAWTCVRICPKATGHLQATGHDAHGRKQYRYHDRWRSIRDATKFDRLVAFGEALPNLRRALRREL